MALDKQALIDGLNSDLAGNTRRSSSTPTMPRQ